LNFCHPAHADDGKSENAQEADHAKQADVIDTAGTKNALKAINVLE
jgi:hypothetical protein